MFLVDSFVEDIRKAFACLCCLVCFGPLLLIIGIWQFAEAPGASLQRAAMISDVNAQINLWKNIEPSFAATRWTVNNIALPINHPSGEIPVVENLESYTATDFFTTSGVIPPSKFNAQANPVVLNFVVTSTTNGTTGGASVSVLPFKATVTSSTSDDCKQGHYSNGYCTNYYVLESVCVKVSKKGNTYTADNTYGGYGCSQFDGLGGNQWSPSVYTQVPYTDSFGNHPSANTYYFNSYTVRAAEDPHLYWLSVSGGYWPLTSGQKVLLGTVLMVIGGIFMIPCILFVVIGIVCFRRKRHHHHHHEGRPLVYA